MPGSYEVVLYEDERGRSQIKEWLAWLGKSNPQARQKARKLLGRLAIEGPNMRPPMCKHIHGPIWELRDRSGIRLYYWRDSERLFVVAAGELKQRDKADPSLIEYALRAYEEWRTS